MTILALRWLAILIRRELGLLYYVMASSQTLGDYSGVPRHSERHQIEFCMFAVLRVCRMLTGQNLVPQHFSIAHHRSGATSEMARFVGTKVEFGADADEFALNVNARELPLIHADTRLNDLLLKYCEAALAERKGGGISQ